MNDARVILEGLRPQLAPAVRQPRTSLDPGLVGRSQLLAGWPGTHSRIVSGIQRAARTVLGVYLKRTCSRVTSASSALGVLNDCALYKSTHSLTHSIFTSYTWARCQLHGLLRSIHHSRP